MDLVYPCWFERLAIRLRLLSQRDIEPFEVVRLEFVDPVSTDTGDQVLVDGRSVRVTREPNGRLAGLMAEANLSHKSMAARMLAEADRSGLDIRPDHVSIRRWLDGVRPHDDTVRCITAVLSAKLGRTITPTDAGFDTTQTPSVNLVEDGAQYPTRPDQAVDLLTDLTDADLADSKSLASARWVGDMAPGVITGYLFSEPNYQDFTQCQTSGFT
jgi:hypothetical protein